MSFRVTSNNPTLPSNTLHSVNLTPHIFAKLALAGAVALALQSAYAENITVNEGDTYTTDIVAEDATTGLVNHGTVENEKIVIKGGTFENDGTIRTDVFDITGKPKHKLQGELYADTEAIFRGTGDTGYYLKSQFEVIDTPKLSIIDTGAENNNAGLGFTTTKALQNVDEIHVESNGHKTGLFLLQGAENGVRYDKTVYLDTFSGGQDARIEVEGVADAQSAANYYVERVVSNVASNSSATNKLQTSNHGTAGVTFEIGEIVVQSGRLNLQTQSNTANDAAHGGTFVLNNVTLAAGASLRASAYEYQNKPSTPHLRIEGNNAFNLGAGATVDFGGWKDAANTDWRPDLITLAADSITINVEDSSSNNLFIVTKNNRETKASDIRVVAAAPNNTGNAAADLEKLVDVVQTNYKDEQKKNHLECLPDVQLEQAANDIFDGAVGVVGAGTIDPVTGDCINCGVKDIRTIDNPNVHGIAEMTALGLHIWRNEIDDMHRRIGDLRDSSGQANGLWTRIYNGKASFGGQSIENKYTAFQFGYDHQVSPGLWLGGALSYTYGDNDFDHGEGDSSLLAVTAYASRLFENGFYLDFTGKVGRMKNSFDIRVGDIRSSGDYHTNAVSVSAEAGWRFDVMKNVFFEPQVEVWYGHVFDAQYETSTGVDVDQASTDSLVGRAGFRLGFECPNNRGSAFIKASVLHDWEGEADFRFSKGGVASRTLTEDLGGTWYEYGIGADFNATEQLHFWAELERGDGGEVDTDYRATIGMRYAW